MAKNYTIKEAVEIIAKGTDLEAIADLGKRFPVLAVKIAKVAAKAESDFVDFMQYIPEHVTANKVNTVIKAGVTETADEDTEEETDAEPKAPKEEAKKAEDSGSKNYDEMSGKELYELLGKMGKRNECNKKYGLKKDGMVKFLKELEGSRDEDFEEEEDEEPTGKYDGKSAKELFEMCRERGIKVKPKQPAKAYAELLEKADAEAEAEEDDDWDDEPEEKQEEKKVKKDKKPQKEEPKKAEVEEDDDDDWDI